MYITWKQAKAACKPCIPWRLQIYRIYRLPPWTKHAILKKQHGVWGWGGSNRSLSRVSCSSQQAYQRLARGREARWLWESEVLQSSQWQHYLIHFQNILSPPWEQSPLTQGERFMCVSILQLLPVSGWGTELEEEGHLSGSAAEIGFKIRTHALSFWVVDELKIN